MADMRSQNKGLMAALRGQKGWLVVCPNGRGGGWGEVSVGWPKDRGCLHHILSNVIFILHSICGS